METIISSLITAGVTLAVCLITNNANQKKTEALICYRIEQLEKKVDKHNGLIEKTYGLEKDMAVVKEKLDVANHRIEDLER